MEEEGALRERKSWRTGENVKCLENGRERKEEKLVGKQRSMRKELFKFFDQWFGSLSPETKEVGAKYQTRFDNYTLWLNVTWILFDSTSKKAYSGY